MIKNFACGKICEFFIFGNLDSVNSGILDHSETFKTSWCFKIQSVFYGSIFVYYKTRQIKPSDGVSYILCILVQNNLILFSM